jgi:hypothetical protein
MIDYKSEVKRLDAFVPGENSKFWKPKTGQYKVKALTELEGAEPFIPKDSKDPEKDKKPQCKLDLLVNDERVTWTMGIGVSPASAYGQLCKLAVEMNGLKDKTFIIVVTSDGKKNTYTIVKL